MFLKDSLANGFTDMFLKDSLANGFTD